MRRLAAFVLVPILAAGCTAAVATSGASPSLAPSVVASAAVPSETPSLAAPTAAPTDTPAPTPSPSPTLAPTKAPVITAKPPVRPPAVRPTEPAYAWGGTASDLTTVAIGGKASISRTESAAGPICSITVKYANGTTQAGLAAHDTWKSGKSWKWSWTVPNNAALVGTAKYEMPCTWGSDTQGSGIWDTFNVTA
jgi:hypothetical protein